MENLEWVKTQIQEHAETDTYWHLINLAYQQIQGISEGLLVKEKELGMGKGNFWNGSRAIPLQRPFFHQNIIP